MYDLDNDFATDEREFDVNELEVFTDEGEADLTSLVSEAELVELEIKVVGERIGLLERDLLTIEREGGDAEEYATLCAHYDNEIALLDDLRLELEEIERANSLVFAVVPHFDAA